MNPIGIVLFRTSMVLFICLSSIFGWETKLDPVIESNSQPADPFYNIWMPVISSGGETDWRMPGANPQRTSWVKTGVDPSIYDSFGVKWYRPIEAYIGQNVQLIAARNKIFVSTARGIYALDFQTGNEVWRYDTELPLGNSPSVSGNILYVGGLDRRIYALNADTGSLIWTFNGAKGGYSANPLVIDNKVLVGNRDGYFYAIDASNGNFLWKFPKDGADPLGPILYSAASRDGRIFFASNDNYAYSLDINNGSLIWRSEKMPGDGYQSWWPVVYKDYVVFSSALAYREQGNPGTESIRDVVGVDDPYYSTMNGFQYSTDFIKTIQRDDVFHRGEKDNELIGKAFLTGIPEDITGITWDWSSGKTVLDASKAAIYLENDGQEVVNRPTNKPWRRGLIVLNSSNGKEFTFDSDNDGFPEFAPFLFAGTKSGNRYPPLVIPAKNQSGATNDVLFAQNFYQFREGWEISKAKLAAWQFGTQYILPVGATWAIDEPFANSAGGQIIYENLCCDRVGAWTNLETGASGNIWDYNKTLETIKLDQGIEPWMKSLAPGYDEMWYESSSWDQHPRLWGNYGTSNGIYHNHGLQNPIIPYQNMLFAHRSNAIIAFGPNSTPLRQRMENETPIDYEQKIKQEYPHIVKPLLKIQTPPQQSSSNLTVNDVQNLLDQQILKMLKVGHLRPGYYNGTIGYMELADYFSNPGDTLLTLVMAYPHVSNSIKPDLEKYIKQHFKMYFDNDLYSSTGWWIPNPTSYDLNNPDGFGQLQQREWMDLPPEVSVDIKSHAPDLRSSFGWLWDYPQINIYAMSKFASTFYSSNPGELLNIYGMAKEKIDLTPPTENDLLYRPWIHNGYIAGYFGFLQLQEIAGQSQIDASLRAAVQNQLNSLLIARSTGFKKDNPCTGTIGSCGSIYWRSFNIARNFIYLTPELGEYLKQSIPTQVNTAISEYDWIAPYWVVTRYEASFGEFASDNLYTHQAMFLAKAYISSDTTGQLLKYIDAPAFNTGDLFFIQTLALTLQSQK
jgi:hypothetical protein